MHILIVRLGAIGDVVMSSALLPGLAARYPQAQLHWLTSETGAELLAHHPLLARVWVLPEAALKHAVATPGRRREALGLLQGFLAQARRHRFDLLIDCQGLLKSALVARLLRARRRVVLKPREGAHLLFREAVREPVTHGGPVCREYRLLAEHLGLPAHAFGMSLQASPAAAARAAARFPAGAAPRVFLFPFTTRPQKHWPMNYFAALARQLQREHGAAVTVLGGPGNLAAARALVQGLALADVVAGPESNLDEKLASIGQADLCIGVDTGLTHMALALRRPTIALFGSTCPYDDLGELPGKVFFDALDCAPCRRRPTCDERYDCMTGISVARVADAARRLLAGG